LKTLVLMLNKYIMSYFNYPKYLKSYNRNLLKSAYFNFNIKLVREYPNANWDFSKISRDPNFDISWVREYPDANWDFSKISRFDISWLREYPDANWDFTEIIKNFEYQNQLIELQLMCRNIPMLKYIYKSKYDCGRRYIPNYNYGLNNDLFIPCILINRGNIDHIPDYLRSDADILQLLDVELDALDLQNMQLLINKNIEIDKNCLQMLNNLKEPIYLQNLGGDIFEVHNWLDYENLLQYIIETYPELVDCNIYIEETLLTLDNSKKIRYQLLNCSDTLEGLLVYKVEGEETLIFHEKDKKDYNCDIPLVTLTNEFRYEKRNQIYLILEIFYNFNNKYQWQEIIKLCSPIKKEKEKQKEYNIKKTKKHYFPQHQYKSSKKAVWCY